jgi:hypothetical protein
VFSRPETAALRSVFEAVSPWLSNETTKAMITLIGSDLDSLAAARLPLLPQPAEIRVARWPMETGPTSREDRTANWTVTVGGVTADSLTVKVELSCCRHYYLWSLFLVRRSEGGYHVLRVVDGWLP